VSVHQPRWGFTHFVSVWLAASQFYLGLPSRVSAQENVQPAEERQEAAPPEAQAPLAVQANLRPPSVTPPPLFPVFSAQPTEAEIFRARVFEEPLVPIGHGTSAAENKALALALTGYLQAGGGERVGAIEGFIAGNPASAWRASLLTNLGIVYRRTGYFSRAIGAWEKAWELARAESDPHAAATADRALGELFELNGRLGRFEALEALFTETEGRDIRGSATEKRAGARHGLWLMQNQPENAFRCGPMALDRILAFENAAYQRSSLVQDSVSSLQGMSLTQVHALARELGMSMQMAKRAPGTTYLVPSVVHWKAGHFAALVKAENDRYLIQDPTFGEELWVSRAALDDETSGYFLVWDAPLPSGWTRVDQAEGETIWGKGNTNGGNPENQKEEDTKVCNGCGGNGMGMATHAVHTMLVNLNITDTPVGHTPPRGPSLQFRVTYNQRDAFQPALFPYSNLGPKWTFGWMSYLVDNPSNPAQSLNLYARGVRVPEILAA
jgi:hypothetical protein